MKTVYVGEAYINATIAQMLSTFREGLSLLVSHTDATVSYSVNTDEELDATVRAGDAVFKVHSDFGSGAWNQQTLTVECGYERDGEYVRNHAVSRDNLIDYPKPFYPELTVINGGALWELEFYVCSGYYSQSFGQGVLRMRSAKIKSSLSNTVYRTEKVYDANGDSPEHLRFPAMYENNPDEIVVENAAIRLNCGYAYGSSYNIPSGSVMLCPTIMYADNTRVPLGVPTIGGERPYFASRRAGSTYTEFYVGGTKYIDLGYCVIRSP